MHYFNENEPTAIAWLKELMAAGLIPDGHIDTRSIVDVRPEDLDGFDQCHFFAGIAGWPLALELAGYQNVKGLWTGSCPCQPFSAAGKRKGTSDARHLWPEMFRLVRECRPDVVLGEQVEAAVRLGWLDGVFGDLEGEGYACGAAVLGAHSVGAPHIRQRLYWGAAASRRVGITNSPGWIKGWPTTKAAGFGGAIEPTGCGADGVDEPESARGRGREQVEGGGSAELGRSGAAITNRSGVGDPNIPRPQGYREPGERPDQLSPWQTSIIIPCADGKSRRISPEPGVFPLAHGVPGRVGLLRGYGNAIVPQVAASFITSFMESIQCSQQSSL